MESADLERLLAQHEFLDEAITFHAFTDFMRDYELVVGFHHGGFKRYRFRNCVRADTASAIPAEGWSRSLDDRFTDFQSAKEADLNGFVWGTKWQCLYPGLTIVRGSPEARDWTKNLGIPFHEVLIETNVHNIRLVFAELAVEDIDVGYTPYTVVHDEPIHVDREDMGEAADWKW